MNSTHHIERLTAAGRGAVAVVSIQTAEPSLIDSHFVAANGMKVSSVAIDRILFGKWREEEVVAVRTAETEWEINCHGGEAAVQRIVSDLQSFGSQTKLPDVSYHDVITSQLTLCRSRRTAEYLLAQREGVFSDFLDSLDQCTDTNSANRLVADCLKWSSFAKHLITPWNVTIAGRPNAGKSSLLNAIIGYERAIVFDQPGTTRDRIEAELLLAGWPIQITDTAGIRDTNDAIESSGVAASISALDTCDLCLLVVDSTVGWSVEDSDILNQIPSQTSIAILHNKTDLTAELIRELPSSLQDIAKFQVSAATGRGLKELLQWIPETMVPNVPDFDQPLPVVPAVSDALQQFVDDSNLATLKVKLRD